MMINTVWRETASCTAEVNVAPILRNIATRNALHNTTSCISGLKQIPVCVIYFVIHCIYLLGCVLFVLFCFIFLCHVFHFSRQNKGSPHFSGVLRMYADDWTFIPYFIRCNQSRPAFLFFSFFNHVTFLHCSLFAWRRCTRDQAHVLILLHRHCASCSKSTSWNTSRTVC